MGAQPKRSRGRLLLLGCACTLAALAGVWLPPRLHDDAPLFPAQGQLRFFFADTGAWGRSSIVPLDPEATLGCAVRLAPGAPHPFAGMGVTLGAPRTRQGIDLAGIDSLDIEYRHVGLGELALFLDARAASDSPPSRLEAPMPSSVPDWTAMVDRCPDGAWVYPATKNWSTVRLPLSAFRAPAWRGGSPAASGASATDALEQVVSIGLQIRGTSTPYPDTAEIRAIRPHRSSSPPAWAILAAFLPLLVAAASSYATKPSSPGTPGPAPLDLPSRSSLEADTLLAWLSANYHREIDLETTGRAVGIHPRRIASILKSAVGRTFPAHLNHLRIAEACRLLSETDRQVSEIASAVGFADPKYFQRTFKSATGATPGQWRSRPRPTEEA